VVRTLQLYQLQALDIEIDQVNQKLADIAVELGDNVAVLQARSELESAEQQLRKAQTVMQDLDLEVKSLTGKIASEEKKLYSGKVLSAKEATNLQDEVTSLKRHQVVLEERLLEALLEVEDLETTLEEKRKALNLTEADWAAKQAALKATRLGLEHELVELKERRPTIAGNVDEDVLNIYGRLRTKKAGRAVAAVKQNVCQGCGMTLSNNRVQRARSETELHYCSTCGRILYVP
jgi:predicted  nucleic acid-binding Zn-ribbon protein